MIISQFAKSEWRLSLNFEAAVWIKKNICYQCNILPFVSFSCGGILANNRVHTHPVRFPDQGGNTEKVRNKAKQ